MKIRYAEEPGLREPLSRTFIEAPGEPVLDARAIAERILPNPSVVTSDAPAGTPGA